MASVLRKREWERVTNNSSGTHDVELRENWWYGQPEMSAKKAIETSPTMVTGDPPSNWGEPLLLPGISSDNMIIGARSWRDHKTQTGLECVKFSGLARRLQNRTKRIAAATLLEVAANPKRLGALIGFLSVLHTRRVLAPLLAARPAHWLSTHPLLRATFSISVLVARISGYSICRKVQPNARRSAGWYADSVQQPDGPRGAGYRTLKNGYFCKPLIPFWR
jgi:hypothetical protein